ncbi:MAG: NAD-dependent epimerase/dehydratase family protein, partial [Myxococcota bacterium]|nr:NAD-dependent epimerase/dehydratase family protein [Myxococcota bacterium]
MTVLVTGAGGFLGGAVARQLVERGETVRSFSRGEYPALAAMGIDVRRGDLADSDAVLAAADGCDAVIHVAARPGIWGKWDDYHRPNVLGTDNVIAACRTHGIGRLVFTSSPSVVVATEHTEAGDESLPYPSRYPAHYPATKALAEQAVLAANDATLSTVALRPHLVWGPGDNHLLPRMVTRSRAGKLALLGSGDNMVDTTWIEDAARAHLLALDRLEPGAACAGRAYFITQGEPR